MAETLDIRCTRVRVNPDEAKRIAAAEHPDLITRLVTALVPRLKKSTEVLEIHPFYCRYYYGMATLRVRQRGRERRMRMAAVMPSAVNMVRLMVGVPQFEDASIPADQVAQDAYTIEEAREKLTDFLRKKGYKKLRTFAEVQFDELSTVYKPFYHCVCRRSDKTFTRVVDAEIGERDYLMDIQYKNLKFS